MKNLCSWARFAAATTIAFTTACLAAAATPPRGSFSVVEATITDMQNALRQGRVTSHELVTQSLMRIATYEDKLNAAITVSFSYYAQNINITINVVPITTVV